MLVALVLSMALMAPAPDAPPKPEPPGGGAEASALKPGEKRIKMVCRMETPTGTRFAKRKCMELSEFQRMQEETRSGFSEMQRNTSYTPPCWGPAARC